MIIRTYEDKDRDGVIDLWRVTGLTTPQNDPERDILRKQSVGSDLFLVASDDSQASKAIIGTIMGGYEGHRGWVNYLGVHPDHQRMGIASRLMQELEFLLISKGCPKINLQVRATNTEAIEFYTALGYLDDKVVGLGKRLEND